MTACRKRACACHRCRTRRFARMLKLPAVSNKGVRVDEVLDIPTTQALIKPDDVIMQVGDYPVDEDGTITYEGNTVGVSAAVDLAQDGDTIPLKVWRDGQMIDVKLPVKVYSDDAAQGNQYDVLTALLYLWRRWFSLRPVARLL